MKRNFLQTAWKYHPATQVAGWFVTELHGGIRCFWDGGISRGLATEQVPWASVIDPRTRDLKEIIPAIATGLWSKFAEVLDASSEFLDRLPPFPCDGMLLPNGEYSIFSSPTWESLLRTGNIENHKMRLRINWEECSHWLRTNAKPDSRSTLKDSNLSQELFCLQAWTGWCDDIYLARHMLLPHDPNVAKDLLAYFMREVFERGGRGVVFRNPAGIWEPFRTKNCMKLERS